LSGDNDCGGTGRWRLTADGGGGVDKCGPQQRTAQQRKRAWRRMAKAVVDGDDLPGMSAAAVGGSGGGSGNGSGRQAEVDADWQGTRAGAAANNDGITYA